MAVVKKPPGRKKGIPNKTTSGVKSNLLQVFEDIGGVRFFADWARENPTEFYKHYVKLLPTILAGDQDNPIAIQQIERVIVKHETPDTDS